MKSIITLDNLTANISVLEEFNNKLDSDNFIDTFSNLPANIENLVISFLEANNLSSESLDCLINLVQKFKNVKVKVVSNILSSYLFRIGFDHKHFENKSIIPNNSQIMIKALVLGGSAGSLNRIMAIISNLEETDISIFIVQHIPEDKKSILDTIIKKITKLAVKHAEDEEFIQEKTIYIAPPGYHTIIKNKRIFLTKDPLFNYSRPSIDLTFESVSNEYKESAIAVLVSGYSNDGTFSLSNLLKNKTTVIIQDPKECQERDLLDNAIKTKNYDYIFPLPEIINYTKRMTKKKELELKDNDIKYFLENINAKYGYDYTKYHYGSISRLIKKEMSEQKIDSFIDFQDFILLDYRNFEALFLEFSVNYTYFFRNSEVFKEIRNTIIPYLSSFPQINIWCAGCSTGEEPYAIAMILLEEGLYEKSRIYATDINPFIIEQAKNGFFSKKDLKKNIQYYQESGGKRNLLDYFDEYKDCIKIKDELKDKITFFQHSLLNKGILNEFNLILCRNVMIYFDKELQTSTIELFDNSLSYNGFLILGENEFMDMNNTNFKVYDKKLKIFKKTLKGL